MLKEIAENSNKLNNYISINVRGIKWRMGIQANERAHTLPNMGAAKENINTVSLTVKNTLKTVNTERSVRKILRTIGTVNMSIGQCLRINSRVDATTLRELKLDTINQTRIWTKNKIFNGVYVIYAEYWLYIYVQLSWSRLFLWGVYLTRHNFFCVSCGSLRNYIPRRQKHRLGRSPLPFVLVCCMVDSALNVTIYTKRIVYKFTHFS